MRDKILAVFLTGIFLAGVALYIFHASSPPPPKKTAPFAARIPAPILEEQLLLSADRRAESSPVPREKNSVISAPLKAAFDSKNIRPLAGQTPPPPPPVAGVSAPAVPAPKIPTDAEIMESIKAQNERLQRSDSLLKERDAKADSIRTQINSMSQEALSTPSKPTPPQAPPGKLIQEVKDKVYTWH